MMGRVRETRKDLPRRMYFHHGAYTFRGKDNKRVNLGKDYGDALRKYADLVGPVPKSRMRISDLLDEYLASNKYLDLEPRTREDYLGSVALLRPVFGAMWPEDIEPTDIYDYMDKRGAPVRANRDKAVLSNVLNLAIRKGLISINPCKSVKRNKETPAYREVLDGEVRDFLPHCPEWLQVYIELKCLVGLRQGDMLKLGLFNLRDDGLYCETGKRKKRLLFRWSDALLVATNRAKALRRKPSEARLFPITARGFKSAWSRAMNKYQPKTVSLRFAENDLRAKVAGDAIDLGMDATAMLGHSSSSVTHRHYVRGTRKVNPLR